MAPFELVVGVGVGVGVGQGASGLPQLRQYEALSLLYMLQLLHFIADISYCW